LEEDKEMIIYDNTDMGLTWWSFINIWRPQPP
jgi:hypothetical protein